MTIMNQQDRIRTALQRLGLSGQDWAYRILEELVQPPQSNIATLHPDVKSANGYCRYAGCTTATPFSRYCGKHSPGRQ
jgi:hypothetical protein